MTDLRSEDILSRLLSVIDKDILPLTEQGVAAGNKIFGAALLRKSDLSLVLAETNNEISNPLWHGEMHALKKFYETPSDSRPKTDELIFLSTHEPCSMCASAITWAGFDNFYYFFSHEDSRDSFSIPHDLKILKAVFDIEPGGYKRSNEFWTSFAIKDMLDDIGNESVKQNLINQSSDIAQRYKKLSQKYQSKKDGNDIPLN